ncbi:SRPBCC family protein [Mesobacillus sp.]|uniref:SRPBCC family protein n=1 Tax=Mesobacillus sp. TaxID=2675271 RepID=UPI0039EF430D
MVDVLTEIEIKSPVERVSEYAANPDNAPEWYVNIDSAEWLTEKPLNLGSKIAFKAKFLGRELAYIYEIIEYVPGRKMVMQTSEGPFPMKTTYNWEAIDSNTTRMTLRNQGEPTGFSKLVSPFMASMMKKANMKDLRKLKEIMEE